MAHHCLVEHQWNKTRQSFPLTLHTSLCLALDCQTVEPATCKIYYINIPAINTNNYNHKAHYCTAVTQIVSSSHLQLKTVLFVKIALATCSHLLLRTASANVHFLITDCPVNPSLHRRQLGISSCCCKNLEQSDSVRQLSILTISLQNLPEDPVSSNCHLP